MKIITLYWEVIYKYTIITKFNSVLKVFAWFEMENVKSKMLKENKNLSFGIFIFLLIKLSYRITVPASLELVVCSFPFLGLNGANK